MSLNVYCQINYTERHRSCLLTIVLLLSDLKWISICQVISVIFNYIQIIKESINIHSVQFNDQLPIPNKKKIFYNHMQFIFLYQNKSHNKKELNFKPNRLNILIKKYVIVFICRTNLFSLVVCMVHSVACCL